MFTYFKTLNYQTFHCFSGCLAFMLIFLMSIASHAQTQKGVDLDGEAAGDQYGRSVNMPDANTIAIGAPLNDGNGFRSGHVRVFSWNGSAWQQKGVDIDGEAAGDDSGYSVNEYPQLPIIA